MDPSLRKLGELKKGQRQKGDEQPNGRDTERPKSHTSATKSTGITPKTQSGQVVPKSSDRSRRSETPQQSAKSQLDLESKFPLRRRETPLQPPQSGAEQIITRGFADPPPVPKKEIIGIMKLSNGKYGIDWDVMLERFQHDDIYCELLEGANKGKIVSWTEADHGKAYNAQPIIEKDIWDDLLSRLPDPTDRHSLRSKQKQYNRNWALLEILKGLVQAAREHYNAQNEPLITCYGDTRYHDLSMRQMLLLGKE